MISLLLWLLIAYVAIGAVLAVKGPLRRRMDSQILAAMLASESSVPRWKLVVFKYALLTGIAFLWPVLMNKRDEIMEWWEREGKAEAEKEEKERREQGEKEWCARYEPPFDAPTIGELWKRIRGRPWADEAVALTRLVIREGWVGLSVLAPVKATFTFDKRSNTGLSGTAAFAVGGTSSTLGKIERKTATAEVSLPATIVAQSLVKLDGVKLERRLYETKIGHTDDYPEIELEFSFGDDVLVLGSTSQGEMRTPWWVRLGDRKWVTDSAAAAEVLELFDSYLRRDTQKQLIDSAEVT